VRGISAGGTLGAGHEKRSGNQLPLLCAEISQISQKARNAPKNTENRMADFSGAEAKSSKKSAKRTRPATDNRSFFRKE
jgi:hypothetical protein